MSPLTTTALVEAEMRRTRVGEDNVMKMVARAALVRELSVRYPDTFWLKGGALLFHVYDGCRASFVDTDFADPTKKVTARDVERVLSIKGEGFELKAEDGVWSGSAEIVKGERIPFTIVGFAADALKNRVNVSVSVREAEVDDPLDHPVTFDASRLLAEDACFPVQGLSREELAAEKMLAWCLKDELFKHFSDLAMIARDHNDIDQEKTVGLIAKKFRAECKADETKGAYARHRLKRPADLATRFATEARLAEVRAAWPNALDTTIWLLANERGAEMTLADVENVIALNQGFWVPLIAQM